MNVVISQPRYLPSINYIHRMRFSDKFIILDTVQRQSRGFENRNKLLCDGIEKWLTIPIKSDTRESILKTKIDGVDWIDIHKNCIVQYYSKFPFYNYEYINIYYSGLKEYLMSGFSSFTEAVLITLNNISKMLNYSFKYVLASNIEMNNKIESQGPKKLLDLVSAVDGNCYISGPNGKSYGIGDVFAETNIKLSYHVSRLPVYKQYNSNKFVDYLAFFDMLFNCGIDYLIEYINQEPILEEG